MISSITSVSKSALVKVKNVDLVVLVVVLIVVTSSSNIYSNNYAAVENIIAIINIIGSIIVLCNV